MRISIIVAASANNVIGSGGNLPWHLAEDLRRFKQITMGKPIVMGRATWESIGRALPGRHSIVMTRQAGYTAEGCDVVASTDDALSAAGDVEEVMVIGGGDIYEQFLPECHRIYMTRVDSIIDGDTLFPELDEAAWQVVDRENFPASTERQYAFEFLILDRLTVSS